MEASFGHWVRRRRKGLDLTQDELAQRVGCSSSLIFKIETDERRPSRQIAELLAVQLEIPPDQSEKFLKVARQDLAALHLEGPDTLDQLPSPPVSSPPLEVARTPTEEAGLHFSTLPVFPTAFLGRENEIDIVSQQLRDPACRLLTLTGPGGVGKTRLAVEVARHLEPVFSDGVYFLSFAGVDQPESILPVVADTLGIIFSGPADPKQQVIHVLRMKNLLLIFDNMEHLVAGSAILGEILEQAPGIRLLLTSREAVHLQWEWIFEVQGLPIPESAQPSVLESNSAIALFLQRTRQSAPQMILTAEQANAIVQICRLVDGLPLAIELAASWARVMLPSEIAAELARGLDLLQTTLQDVSARHRSIRLVFDHSWRLLTEVESAALMRLAVFPSGFTRDAAQKVTGTSVVLLSALVSKSLLRYGKTAGRYDFHELVRQYVLARLHDQADLEQSAHTQHAEYFARWLGDLESPLKSAQQIAISASIRAETANWSAAWRWSAQHQRLDLLMPMAPCLYWYFEIHGDNAEALATYAYAVDELRNFGAPAALCTEADKSAFAMLVTQLGWFEFRVGNITRSVALYTECLQLVTAMKDPDPYVLCLLHIDWGYLALITGEIDEAGRLTQQSLVFAREFESPWNMAVAVNILGIVEFQRGHLEEAYRQLNESLKIWRDIGDLRGLVFCMLYLSQTAQALGYYDEVETILQESNAISHQKTDRWAHAFGLDLLGHLAIKRGQVQAARDFFGQSLALSQEIGDQWAATQTMIHLGEAQLALDDLAGAQQLFRQAYDNARQAHWLPIILEVMIASLSRGGEVTAETKMAVLLAVLAHSATNQATRQRAEQMRDELAATLDPKQIEAAQVNAYKKPAEEWGSVLFYGRGEGNLPHESSLRGQPAESNQTW
jgi:predicted ATPase/transcriptional regulator with XRE-family HTH domain